MELPPADIFAWAVAVVLIGAGLWPRLRRGRRPPPATLLPPRPAESSQRAATVNRACAIHLETTGLTADDRVVCVAAVELIDGRLTGRAFHAVANPGRPSRPSARHKHGLSDEYLAQQQPFSAIAVPLRHYLGEDLLIGHNVELDRHMLNAGFHRCGVRLIEQEVYCTMTTYKERNPDHRLGLAAAAAALGLERGSGHPTSVEDAILVAGLYQALTGHSIPAIDELPLPADQQPPLMR
jgi:DNA polymerase III epsilon subunit family exonuclease